MLLIIAIVGTTVAPWQLFFQQSYVVDKRITPRFIKYERLDLWIGIAFVIIGAVAMMGFAAEVFSGQPEADNFTDAAAVAVGLEQYAGKLPAIAVRAGAHRCLHHRRLGGVAVDRLCDRRCAVVAALAASQASDAKAFYGVYFGLILLAAILVINPGTPLGLLTNAVQTLAGVLLPSATVFLLLLCNDRAVLGPWVNSSASTFSPAPSSSSWSCCR